MNENLWRFWELIQCIQPVKEVGAWRAAVGVGKGDIPQNMMRSMLFALKPIQALTTELKVQFFWLAVSKARHQVRLVEMPTLSMSDMSPGQRIELYSTMTDAMTWSGDLCHLHHAVSPALPRAESHHDLTNNLKSWRPSPKHTSNENRSCADMIGQDAAMIIEYCGRA